MPSANVLCNHPGHCSRFWQEYDVPASQRRLKMWCGCDHGQSDILSCSCRVTTIIETVQQAEEMQVGRHESIAWPFGQKTNGSVLPRLV